MVFYNHGEGSEEPLTAWVPASGLRGGQGGVAVLKTRLRDFVRQPRHRYAFGMSDHAPWRRPVGGHTAGDELAAHSMDSQHE